MPRSAFALEMDAIQRAVTPLLKERGFRKRGRTYNRSTGDGLVHVVNLQMGASDPPGTTPVPGLRESLHGLFTVNLGVHIPEVARRHGGGVPRGFVQEYHCALRARLGNLTGEQRDIWWRAAAEPAVVEEILRRLERDALPILDRLSGREAVLREWPAIAASISQGASAPWRIVAAIMSAETGDLARARDLLREQARDTHNPRHPEYVRALAAELGAGWDEE